MPQGIRAAGCIQPNTAMQAKKILYPVADIGSTRMSDFLKILMKGEC